MQLHEAKYPSKKGFRERFTRVKIRQVHLETVLSR